MAKAVHETIEVEKVETKKVKEKVVHLILSPEEAKFLASILVRVGGDKTRSRRRHQVPISGVLRELGYGGMGTTLDMDGSIYFKNE